MSLRKQATVGLVWTYAQQFGNQLVGFVVSLILARLLLPEEFGLIGMIAVFVSVGNTLLKGGLTQSLIRSHEPDQVDYSTVFYFNLITSVLIYVIIYFLSPTIADFYEQEILTDLLRVYCLSFIFGAFSAVQLVRLTKKMDFKTQTLIAIPSTILGGVVGIAMAYSGYGVWSLVWSYLITSLGSAIQLWIYARWSPSFVFSKRKFFEHLNFGYKLTLAGLLSTIFSNIYLIIIGKYFSAAQVGFYTRAETMKQLPVANISDALSRVTYPLFASIQDDAVRLKRVYKQIMKMVIFVIAPTLIILAVLAEPTFRFLFTEKWLPAVPYFQILCITGILHPIHSYNLNILNVKGRSDLFLKLEAIKKVFIVIVVIIAVQFGIMALLYGQVILSVISFVINTHYSGTLINYKGLEQLKDILPALLLAIFAGGIVFIVDYAQLSKFHDIYRILGGTLLGGIIYIVLAYFLRFSSVDDLKLIIKN